MKRFEANDMDDFRSCTAPLRVRDAVGNNLVVKRTRTSNYPMRSEVPSQKFFAQSSSAYRRSHPNAVTGLVFYVASAKILTVAARPLPIFHVQAGELSSFFGALEVDSHVAVFFVADVGLHGIEQSRLGCLRTPARTALSAPLIGQPCCTRM